ncbi:MAG: phosphopentomutase [Clostridia bacterium]|nr:phosphopentomutase [Clostridia bacterium]
MKFKRVFLIVMDSFGIGGAADAAAFGDEGSNTLAALGTAEGFHVPNLTRLGLYHIEGNPTPAHAASPVGAYGRMCERSQGKDTTIGHWELAGVYSEEPLPTYPDGFPPEIIRAFEERTGRRVICNRPYSGVAVIADYGREHLETGALIVYTSADSVFQIAAHESVVPVEELYRYCEIARELLVGKHCVGRVIARPFEGEHPFRRTARRHDFSAVPPKKTMLDRLRERGLDTICVGKISDIFAGEGVSESTRTGGNDEGLAVTRAIAARDFTGLCFVNLVDFDMLYGHRRDVRGYADAVMRFDAWLPDFTQAMREGDLLIITADHGCDPSYGGTDHTRENVPLLVYGYGVKAVDLGTRTTYADVAATVADIFGAEPPETGESFLAMITEE